MPVFERACEEDVETGRPRLELGTNPKPTITRASRPRSASSMDLDALVFDELAVVDDGRPVSGEKRAQAQRVRVRKSLVGVLDVRRIEL